MGSAICLAVILVAVGVLAYFAWQANRGAPSHLWRYCPWCGSKLETGNIEGKERRKCTKCKFVHWDNPRPVAVVLIPTTDGGLVLIKRNVEPRKGKFALPGGFVEPFESIEAGAAREAKEETGLDVEIEREVWVVMPPGVNEHLHFFLAKPTSATPKSGSDAAEVVIVKPDSIPAEVAFQTHRQMIEGWFQSKL
jgi:8-oxo-dGTP diphosphatase